MAHTHRISDWEHVVCKKRNDKRVSIDETIISDLSSVGKRSITICIWATACLSRLISIITSAVIIVKRQKKNEHTKRRRQLIQNIANQEPGFEFAVYLAHSNDDYTTVIRHMLPPLEQKLQDIVGVERDLVFLGDKHYQVGYPIFEETMRSIKISCSVVFVVSEAFCRSNYCQIELQQAYELNKPIILMIKEACPEELMFPLLKFLFLKEYARYMAW